jgi:STE24 endopeptidase
MNLWLIVLVSYLAIQLTEIFMTVVNLQYLSRPGHKLPEILRDYFSSEKLVQMNNYSLTNGKFGILQSLFGLSIAVIFLFAGLLDWYNSFINDFNWSGVLSAIVFFLVLTYGETLLNIPFGLYSTFVIEEKFGFNNQTLSLWLLDMLKGLLVNTVLMGILLGGAFWMIFSFPDYWWFTAWLFFFSFSIFLLYVSPYIIEPLFNKYTPISDPELEDRIKQTMNKAGLSISRVFSMDASKRSNHGNAYFSGIGSNKRIVLFDTLLENNNHDELIAILAHEAGHWKRKHLLKRLIMLEVFSLLGMYSVWFAVQDNWILELFKVSQDTIYAKLLLAGVLMGIVLFPLKPLSSWYSRKHEYEADNFATELTGKPEDLAHALIKLSRDNLSNLFPHPLFAWFHYSHPPLLERVASLLK